MAAAKDILQMVDAIVTPPVLGSEKGRTKLLDDEAALTITRPGDDSRTPEAVLMEQASTLDAIFKRLANRALGAHHAQQLDGLLRLAFKAQSQCAQTLRVLGELKNPKQVAFVQQANIAQGHQQIINQTGMEPCADSKKTTSELLEYDNGKWLEPGAASKTIKSNSTLEAVAAVNRPDD